MPGAVLRSLWRERSLAVLRGLYREVSAVGNMSRLMDYGVTWTEESWAQFAKENACLIGVAWYRLAGCFLLDFRAPDAAVLHVVRLPGIDHRDAFWFWCELRRMYPRVALVAHLSGPLRRHARVAALRHGFRRQHQGLFVLKGS